MILIKSNILSFARQFTIYVLLSFLTSGLCRAQSLVLPGDYPDPSVVKIGDSYWASATSSNWAPAFPVLESKDLFTWQLKSYVFNQLPSWADFYFWAPEITYDKGKVYVYYSAHKKNGNLCIGVASADVPEGPYQDHGPLICQEAGSIDAFPMRDTNGKLYLIWKEDGNSISKPTPIWAMAMSEDRTKLLGEKKELFRNNAEWEGNLVEGLSMIRYRDYFYAFYAASGCCGRACTYGVGVARSKTLLGPWEKYHKNPVLKTGEKWKCPGHGTPVQKGGKFYFLFHAYNVQADVYAGRQGILSEFIFTADGWIDFVEEALEHRSAPSVIVDEFNGTALSPHWQWSVFQEMKTRLSNGVVEVYGLPDRSGAFLGQKIYTSDYEAETILLRTQTTAEGGLGLVGDEKNFVGITVKDKKLMVRKLEGDKEIVLEERNIDKSDKVYFRVRVKNGKEIKFYYSTNGTEYTDLLIEPVDGFFLPPWDRAVRIALIAKGESFQKSVFENFVLKNKN